MGYLHLIAGVLLFRFCRNTTISSNTKFLCFFVLDRLQLPFSSYYDLFLT
jgi:hypothetical protein